MADFVVEGMDDLLAAFEAAPDKVIKEAAQVTSKAALNIKKGMQQDVQGIRHAPRLPYAITYDTKQTKSSVEAEVGPVEGGAGSLAFFWFGNSKVGPQADIMRPLREETPTWLEYLSKVGTDALG